MKTSRVRRRRNSSDEETTIPPPPPKRIPRAYRGRFDSDTSVSTIVLPPPEPEPEIKLVPPFTATCADDIETIAKNYRGKCIDRVKLFRVLPALKELDEMIGMEEVKKTMYDFVIYTAQSLHYLYAKPLVDIAEEAKETVEDEWGGESSHSKRSKKAPQITIIGKGDNGMSAFFESLFNKALNAPQPKAIPQNERLDEGDLYHTVLLASPGHGKSTVAGIIGKIYSMMLFNSDKVISSKRSDLIGQYVGETEVKTQAILDQAMGGTLILDEAYSLAGTKGHIDVFSQGCVDLIMRHLTERKRDFVCIIIGYEEQMKNLFGANPGLERRFPRRIVLPKYSCLDLARMFIRRISKEGWSIDSDCCVVSKLIEPNMEHFNDMGGDVDVLFTQSKILYARRNFGLETAHEKKISTEDVSGAIKILVEMKKKRDEKDPALSYMYT